jgi:hypothetical protein
MATNALGNEKIQRIELEKIQASEKKTYKVKIIFLLNKMI